MARQPSLPFAPVTRENYGGGHTPPPGSRFRLSYGNGQIEGPFPSRAEAEEFLLQLFRQDARYVTSYRIQFEDPENRGDWHTAKLSAKTLAAIEDGSRGGYRRANPATAGERENPVESEAMTNAPVGALLLDSIESVAYRKEGSKRWRRQKPTAGTPDGWGPAGDADLRTFQGALRLAREPGAHLRVGRPNPPKRFAKGDRSFGEPQYDRAAAAQAIVASTPSEEFEQLYRKLYHMTWRGFPRLPATPPTLKVDPAAHTTHRSFGYFSFPEGVAVWERPHKTDQTEIVIAPQARHKAGRLEGVLAHEIGHFVDWIYGGQTQEGRHEIRKILGSGTLPTSPERLADEITRGFLGRAYGYDADTVQTTDPAAIVYPERPKHLG